MEIIALAKNVRVTPRKAREVSAAVKGQLATVVLEKLSFLAKASATPIAKALKSAMASATNNYKLKLEDLRVKNITVDEGLKMKRRDTSHGARYGGGVIMKKTSHIKVILEG